MPEHGPFSQLPKDWSPERRARFEVELRDQAEKLRAERVGIKPAYTYPVAREEIEILAPAALRCFEHIATHLDLSPPDKLALLGLAEHDEIPDPGAFPEEQFYRLSYFIGIWLDVGAVLGGKEGIVRWLRVPVYNEEYGGRSRLDFLIGEGLPGFDHIRREANNWAHNG